MTEATQNSPVSAITVGRWCSQNRHFLVVATVLAVVWAGWTVIMFTLGLVFDKEAVEWPACVEVDPIELRMTSLAKSFGPDNRFELAGDGELFYRFLGNGELFVTESGELLEAKDRKLFYKDRSNRPAFTGKLSELTHKKDGKAVLDGLPDGERTISGEVLDLLAIGTSVDRANVGERKSTWYVSRTYIDRQKLPGQRYRLWQLDVTYYTGTMDKVPHYPEQCLTAGGMDLGSRGYVEFSVPGVPGPWGAKPVNCRFVGYSDSRITRENLHAQYYVFSVNGYPESSRDAVRLKLASIFGKYIYFAKIQFHPLNEIKDFDESKQAAAEFVKYMLPEVLKALPMPEDIKRLESGAP